LEEAIGSTYNPNSAASWIAGLGVSNIGNRESVTMAEAQKYQEANYKLLEQWLADNGKKAKE